MKYNIIFFLLLFFAGFTSIAQQIPLGSCGIINKYDETGSPIKRFYYCYNGGPYLGRQGEVQSKSQQQEQVLEKGEASSEFQEVDALYPNPTTGIFFIAFSKLLKDAAISIADINGKVIHQYRASGTKLTIALSSLAAGSYFVRIEEGGKVITKKVIKQ